MSEYQFQGVNRAMRAIQTNMLLSVAAFFGLLVAFPVNAFAHGVTEREGVYLGDIWRSHHSLRLPRGETHDDRIRPLVVSLWG